MTDGVRTPTMGGFDARIEVDIEQGVVHLRQSADKLFMESHMSPDAARKLSKALADAADACERLSLGPERVV